MIYTIFGGVNGVGKSTIYYMLDEKEKQELGIRINVDELVSSIGSWQDEQLQMNASRQTVSNIKHCIDNNISFNQETTLAGKSIITTIKRAKAKDYIVNLNYVFVDSVEIAKQRVLERVKRGGHGIAEELIERRYTQSLENLKLIMPLCDKIRILDNSKTIVELVLIEHNKIHYINKETSSIIKKLL